MKFFCIDALEPKNCGRLLKEATLSANIEFVHIHPLDFDLNLIDTITSEDFLYRVGTDKISKRVFYQMALRNPTTFHRNGTRLNQRPPILDEMLMIENSIETPKTEILHSVDKGLLSYQVQKIGGFPIILKIVGGMKGVGVIKVESLESLISILDYINLEEVDMVIKEFIDVGRPVYSYRAVVLGNNVELIYKNQNVSDSDFRSNVDQKERKRELVDMEDELKHKIVKAVKLLDIELGGVDFLFSKDNELKILEVNFPFNFWPIVKDFDYPMHEKIVQYLKDKSGKLIE